MPATIPFGPLQIAYDARVLRPRPWTALQAQWAAELLLTAPPGPFLELCAGVGHIGLLAARLAGGFRRLVQVDESAAAQELARENAARAGLPKLIDYRRRPMQDALEPAERFALVIADPPWVPTGQTGQHPDDPADAIDGGPDGLVVARACVDLAVLHLLPGASLLIQLGDRDQARRLADQVVGVKPLGVREGEGGVVARFRSVV